MIGLIKGTARQARTVSGLPLPIASYKNNSKSPIQELSLSINPTQSGSGDPAPDNIRPITGVSSVNVCNTPMPVAPLWSIDSSFNGHVEFNQLCNISSGSSTVNSVAISRDGNGKVTLNGTCDLASGSVNALVFSFSSSFINGHKYLVGAKGTRAKHLTVTPNGVNNYMGDFRLYNSAFNLVVAIFSGETYNNESIYPMIIDLTQMFGSTIADYIYSLEQGTAGAGVAFFRSIYPNDYYAYDTGTDEMVGSREGNTYLIQLGDTYYGGKIDIVDGNVVMTCDEGFITYDGDSSENWNYTNNGYAIAKPSGAGITSDENQGLCNLAVYTSATNVPNGNYRIGAANFITRLHTGNSDVPTFKTYLSNNPLQVVYPLDTPFTVNLGSISILTLLGSNNIWHDGNGDVEVLKFMDRQLYFGR